MAAVPTFGREAPRYLDYLPRRSSSAREFFKDCARRGTRTPTEVNPLAPQASASTNSAILAGWSQLNTRPSAPCQDPMRWIFMRFVDSPDPTGTPIEITH